MGVKNELSVKAVGEELHFKQVIKKTFNQKEMLAQMTQLDKEIESLQNEINTTRNEIEGKVLEKKLKQKIEVLKPLLKLRIQWTEESKDIIKKLKIEIKSKIKEKKKERKYNRLQKNEKTICQESILAEIARQYSINAQNDIIQELRKEFKKL